VTRKIITDRQILKGHTEIHPALDFYNGKAIVAVGRPGLTTYEDKSNTCEQYSICITSDGDFFILSIKEILDRKLYYLKDLDLPSERWEIEDQEQFLEQLRNGNKTKFDFKKTHQEIRELFVELFDFQDEKLYDFFSCFIIYTYFFPLFESAPVVHLWGPAGSGKTKIMEMLGLMAFNPVTSGNITEASVFRLVEGRRAVCLLDESEDLSKTERGHAITNLILNGYRRGNLIYRMDKVGKVIQSSHYDVYSPKVIANITGLDKEALLSRAIRVTTNSSRNAAKANKYTVEIKDKADAIRNKLYRACLTRFEDVRHAMNTMPRIGLVGRSAEIWQGVLSIAWLVNDKAWHNLSWLAIENSKSLERELLVSNPIWDLFSALLYMVDNIKPKFYSNNQIWNCINKHAEGEFISKQQVTGLLKQQGIPQRIKWIDKKTTRGFVLNKEQLESKLSVLADFITPQKSHLKNSQSLHLLTDEGQK